MVTHKHLYRILLVILLFAATIVILIAASCRVVLAYGDQAHEQLTSLAFNFLLEQGKVKNEIYPDAWNSKRDYQLGAYLNKTLAQDKLLKLIKYTTYTDYFSDLSFDTPLGKRYSVPGVAFTVFSHFLNIQRAGIFWERDGYHYPWVSLEPACTRLSRSNLSNILIKYGDSSVIRDKSQPYIRYKHGLRASEGVYEANFSKKIKEVRFWPATSMAQFWYEQLMSSPIDPADRLPLTLHFLATVFHIVQDLSVPFHAAGISGCGHDDFEDWIEKRTPVGVYDESLVRKHLKESFLSHSKSVAEIAGQVAGVASKHCRPTFNKEIGDDVISCRHLVDPVVQREVVKDVVNLAIAGTVIIIRKAISEWGVNDPNLWKQIDLIASTATESSVTHESSVKLALGVDSGEKVAPDEANLRRHVEKLYGPREWKAVEPFYRDIRSFFAGQVSNSQVDKRLGASDRMLVSSLMQRDFAVREDDVQDIADLYPGSPPVLVEKTREFRLPTFEETETPDLWRKYMEERKKQTDAAALVLATLERSYLKSKADKTASIDSALTRLDAFIRQTTEENVTAELSAVRFDFGTARLSQSTVRELDGVIKWTLINSDKVLVVAGHTDGQGSEAYNEALAQRRATVVRDYLVRRGLPPKQIQVLGFGESKPVCVDGFELCQSRNRRVTFSWK
jgi:outer membrane protein OmpA-like peptidoglycan-associated protein